jgi:hypothetical protein
LTIVGGPEWTGPAELPPALRSWGAAFSTLTPAVMTALVPMLHRLDELFSRHGDVESVAGEPAGLAGLSTRGIPERLLVSEWLLAEEVPEEFLRRAASRELLHLDTAYRNVPPAGTTRVVVDVGPSQAGAARLVQLAALVVLHRRARSRGSDLELGVLGESVDRWHSGELPELLRTWLTARRASEPTPDEVHARHEVAGRAWFLLAPGLATRLHGRGLPGRRVLTAEEADWSDAGVAAARVMLAGEGVHLPLLPHPIGLRVLRGEGFRHTRAARSAQKGGTAVPFIRNAGFSGTSRKLVGRGTQDGDVVTADVGSGPRPARVREQRFPGTVVAASVTGRRMIVVHQHGAAVKVSVVGRRLGDWHGLSFPREVLGLSSTDLAEIVAGPPLPVHHAGGSLWIRLPSGWHMVGPSSDVVPATSTAVVTPTGPDSVTHVVRLPSAGLWTQAGRIEGVAAAAPVVAGAGWVAVQVGLGRWRLVGPGGLRHEFSVTPGDEPAGLVTLSNVPHLVVRSAAGLLLRLTGPGGTRTLTGLSGAAQRVSVHPTMPILARDLADGRVEVHDLSNGTRLGVFSGSLG